MDLQPIQNKGEIVLYQPDEITRLEVRIENETVWLTQAQMVDLFQRDRTVITKHINNVFREGELDEQSNVHFLHIANSDKPVKIFFIDDDVYHIGASLKDLGKKWFAFSKMGFDANTLLQHIIYRHTDEPLRIYA